MNPKQSQQQQRSRGRSNGGNVMRTSQSGGHNKHINIRVQNFDSNGPEGRIRGSAHQVMEKYLALGRDAFSQGDRVAAENFYQHAEHYLRLINAYNQSQPAPRRNDDGTDGAQPVIVDAPLVAENGDNSRAIAAEDEQPSVLPVDNATPAEQPRISVVG